ncbi:MAG: acyl-CoA dehydrogenase family protein [Phenylobacterium sp.]|nr:acyl-CoA dehydrogenase family protein [Phenylobacterium sp.]
MIGGWILGRQAMAAAGSDDPWLKSKGTLARLYAGQVLSLAPGRADGVCQGLEDLEATPAQALAG